MKKNPFEKLEEKLNIASSLLNELEDTDNEEVYNLQKINNENLPCLEVKEIFSISLLQQDFFLIRQNLLSLVAKGQRLLDSCSVLDMTELKASQIEAISNLNTTIANNLKMIIDIYKQISDIESKKINKINDISNTSVNTGTVNNIVFAGTTDELVKQYINVNNLNS